MSMQYTYPRERWATYATWAVATWMTSDANRETWMTATRSILDAVLHDPEVVAGEVSPNFKAVALLSELVYDTFIDEAKTFPLPEIFQELLGDAVESNVHYRDVAQAFIDCVEGRTKQVTAVEDVDRWGPPAARAVIRCSRNALDVLTRGEFGKLLARHVQPPPCDSVRIAVPRLRRLVNYGTHRFSEFAAEGHGTAWIISDVNYSDFTVMLPEEF